MTWLRLHKMRRFAREERGTVTVELCIWLPFLLGVIGMILDLSMILTKHAQMWSIASDTTRQIVVGSLDPADATTYANENALGPANYTASVSQSGDLVTTTLTVPWNAVSVTYWFREDNAQMAVTVTQRMEPTT